MQTFLPYQSFSRTAQALDPKRLGKQRVEARQILDIILGHTQSKAWTNHPAVRMWRGHDAALKVYYNCICQEWMARGYRQFMPLYPVADLKVWDYPPWLTDDFCRAHQSNLVRKAPDWYRPLWPDVPDNLPYIWPA